MPDFFVYNTLLRYASNHIFYLYNKSKKYLLILQFTSITHTIFLNHSPNSYPH